MAHVVPFSRVSCALLLASSLVACGGGDAEPGGSRAAVGQGGAAGRPAGASGQAGASGSIPGSGAVTASEVVSFDPGDGAGFGAEAMPGVVLGPPHGGGATAGSTDVVSLGAGGEIVLGFGAYDIVDGPGPDFLVFENPFFVGGDPKTVFKELGEVSVSEDGVSWVTFPCDAAAYTTSQCAGWHPVYAETPEIRADDPDEAGGDPFDLAAIGLPRARYVKIRDLSKGGAAPTAGFDLDAVSIVHHEKAR